MLYYIIMMQSTGCYLFITQLWRPGHVSCHAAPQAALPSTAQSVATTSVLGAALNQEIPAPVSLVGTTPSATSRHITGGNNSMPISSSMTNILWDEILIPSVLLGIISGHTMGVGEMIFSVTEAQNRYSSTN